MEVSSKKEKSIQEYFFFIFLSSVILKFRDKLPSFLCVKFQKITNKGRKDPSHLCHLQMFSFSQDICPLLKLQKF